MTQKDMKLLLEIQTKTGNSAAALQQLIALMKQIALAAKESTEIEGIDNVLKELDALENSLKQVGEDSGKAADGMDELSSRARVENLKELSGTFQGISEKLLSMATSMIDSAAKFENLYTQMLTVSGGSKELADDMMAWAEQFAATTPFALEDIVGGTAKLQAYGLEAKKVFTQIGDLAAGYGKGLDQAIEAVADAQAGELERLKEFGITKQMLIERAREEFNAEIVNSQQQIVDLDSMNQALFSIMEERTAGAMGRMSQTYTGAMNNFQDATTKFQASLGKELLPILTDLIRQLTEFIDWLNGLGEGFTGVVSQAILFTTAIVSVSSGLISAGLQLQAFKAQLLAANAAAAASGASFTSLSVSLTGIVPVVGAIAIVFGTLANAYITAWRKMEEQKAEKIVEETKKIASGFKNVQEAIESVNKTPLELAFEGNIEQRLESVEARVQAIRELQIENLKLMNQMEGKESSVTVTTSGYNKFSSGLSTKSAWVPAEPGEEGAKEYTKTQTLELSEAYDLLSKNVEVYSQKLASVDPKSEEHDAYNRLLAESATQLRVLTNELDRSNPAHAEQIRKYEELIAKLKEAGQEQNILITTLINAGKAQDNYIQPLEEASKAINDYVKELDNFQHVQDALGEVTPALQELAKKEKVSEEELNATLEAVAEKYGVTVEELKKYALDLASGLIPEINDDKIKEYIDSLDALVQAQEITADEKNDVLQRMVEDERLSAEAQQKVREELAKSTKKIVTDIAKTEKERWETFETAQKTALAKGEITERQYWENVGKYLKDNEKNLEDSNDLKTELTREYYEGIKKLGEKDVQDEEKRLREKEKAFKDHLNRLKDLQDIGEISPEKRLKELEKILETEKLTEEQRIEVKKEALEIEEQLAEEKEKIAEKEAERQKANLQLQIETLEEEGKISEAKKLRLEMEVEEKRQAGLDEVAIENWKNAQLAKIDKDRIEQNKKVEQEILAQKKEGIQEEIQYIQNKTEQIASKTGNRVAAEREAHTQIMALEREQTDLIIQEYDKRIDEIHKQAEEYEKSGADRVKVEEFVAESVKDLQLEVLNDFLEKEEQKRKEIEATAKTIEDIDKKLAENRAKQAELEGGYFNKGDSPLMSMEEAFALPKDKSGKITHLDPIVARWEELKTLKEEEISLEEEKVSAIEKEKMLLEELQAIEQDRLKIQTEFNAKLKEAKDGYDTIVPLQSDFNDNLSKTAKIYSDITASSPWSEEINGVQQYTSAIQDALAALQELNANEGAGGGGGERTPGDQYEGEEPSSGGSGRGGEEGYQDSGGVEPPEGTVRLPDGSTALPGYYNLPEGQGRSESGWDREPNTSVSNTYNINIGDKQIESNGQFGSAVDSISQISDLALKYWT